ncbi:BadF/BadG/BcrA/BcrD ATPase family protein, partial [Escherichia coli]|uniref:BadF/BadG/BcrA/BcrD ATPase family protein n=1 Tax=Escherichia coli TaxID=562 RepID=UPI002FBEB2C4
DDDGTLCDFLMNDKCAAGTGRLLEVISRTLGTSVEQHDSITENVTPPEIGSAHRWTPVTPGDGGGGG